MEHKAMVCWCGKNSRIRTSWTILNLGRRFVVCAKLENSLAKARRREKVLWAVLVVSWMLIARFFFGGNDGSDGLKLKTLELA
ncbi:uncharacterized protein Pyn_04975 [Prunus yedoensis var. nudiflora]|uniref:Transmembrane protein n=1 Tax=Prunus yedoensis var. nudiflora TaxID=2094558 RepID=A0A314UJA1_PRUYE|nr:uncharacterized protein Pyn_04975 [Prunus yedoensis var. nudiflora]